MSPSNSFNPDLVLQTTSLPQPQPQLPTQPGSLPSPPAPPSFNSIGSLASSAHLLRRPSVDPSTSTSQSAPSSNPSLPKLPLPSSNPPLHPLISVRRPSLPITTSPFTSPLLKEEIITSPSPLNHGFRSPTTSNASSTQPAELKIHEPLSSHSHRPNHRSSSPTSYKSTSSFTSSAATHQIPLSSPHGWFSTPKDHSRSSAHVQTPSESHSITPLISHPARSHSYKAPPKRTPDPQLKMSPSMHPGHLASMAISERDAPSDLSPPSRLSDASKAFRTHSGVLEIRLPRHPGPSSRPASSVPWPNVIDDLEEVPEGPFQRPRVVSSIKPTPRHSRAGPRPITQSKASQAPSNTQAPEDLHQHTPPRRQRVYETHPGNLSFCLDGRLVSSRPAQRIDLGWCGTAWIEAYVKLWLKPRLHRAQRKAGRSPSPEGPRDPTPAAPSGSNAREIARNVQRLDQQLSWLMDLQARIKAQCIIHLPLQTIGSFALLIGIGLLFLIKTTHKLIHPSGNEAGASGGGIVLVVVFVYSWTLCFSSMIKTMSSDPGVLPRGLDPSPEMEWKSHGIEPEKKVIGEEEVEMTMDTGEWELLPRWIKIEPKRQDYNTKYTSRSQPDGVPDQDEEGVAWIQCKWCPTCETYRPPRSSHCRACDSCVDGIDHHCTYLNTCIGARNYRCFFTFLITCVLNLLIVFGGSIWNVLHTSHVQASSHPAAAEPLSLFLTISSAFLLIPISALLSYHVFLTFSGMTTVEYIKQRTAMQVLKENEKLVASYIHPTHDPEAGRRSSSWWWWWCSSSSVKTGRRVELREGFRMMLLRLCAPGSHTWIDWRGWVDEVEGETGSV